MPKQTRLDEHAEIYQPRKEQTEKEKLKDMNFRDKLAYLREYYKIHAAIAVAVIALIIYIVHEILTPDIKPQFYAAIINSTVDPTVIEQYSADFASFLQLDPKRESVELNNTFYLSEDEYISSSQQVLSTYMAVGEIDVIIAPESTFKQFNYYGYFAKLSDELPTDVYSSLTDDFFISGQKEDPEKNAYGIYLNNSNLFKDATYNGEPYILGIIPNYSHEDNTLGFIKYLFRK
jgi:hypothetical protein